MSVTPPQSWRRTWSTTYSFPRCVLRRLEGTSMINASLLRYLVLEGDYVADVPYAAAIVVRAAARWRHRSQARITLPLSNTSRFFTWWSCVLRLSAVVGGTIDASSLPASAYAYPDRHGTAITIVGGANNYAARDAARQQPTPLCESTAPTPRSPTVTSAVARRTRADKRSVYLDIAAACTRARQQSAQLLLSRLGF